MEKNISENLFIVGAGFTKAANSTAPLNTELVDAILRVDKGTLIKYSEKYKSKDIERILTLLDIDIETNPNGILINDRKKIEHQIANYFTRFRFKPGSTPDWIKQFAIRIVRPNDTILCLNYDCYLEGALDYFRVWTPNGGYPIYYPLADDDDMAVNPKRILIYKIHGSENFREAEIIGTQQGTTGLGFLIEESIFPVSGSRKHFNYGGPDSRPYIIAPSFVKIPHLQIAYMMLDILQIAHGARNLVIIGCGMRKEDSFLTLVLTRFLYGSPKNFQKRLIVLSPTSDGILNRIGNYTESAEESVEVISIPFGMENGIEELLNRLVLS